MHQRHNANFEASWQAPFVAPEGVPEIGTLPILGLQLPVLYFPHGKPSYWIWDSHIASKQEQRASSWSTAKKIFIDESVAYQIAVLVDHVIG